MDKSKRLPTFDSLPLFASEEQIAAAVLGERRAEWPAIAALLETKGLPRINSLMGGRYAPAVRRFFDADNGLAGGSPPTAADGVEDMAAWKKVRRRG